MNHKKMEEQDLILQDQASRCVYSIGRWYRFFAIFFMVIIVFMVLLALMMFLLGGKMGNQMSALGLNQGLAMPSFALGLLYLFCGGIYVPMAIFLNRGAKSAREATSTGDLKATVDFLSNTRKYWKYYGIITIVILALTMLFVLSAVILGVASAM